MTESIHDYVIEQLQRRKGRWSEVANGAGMSKRTIEKIARRETTDPGVSLIQRLADYFKSLDDGTPLNPPQ